MSRSAVLCPAVALAFVVGTAGCGSQEPVDKVANAVDHAAHHTERAVEHAAEKASDVIDGGVEKTEKAMK